MSDDLRALALRYSVVVKWSDEDQAYIASSPDLPGLLSDADTRAEALAGHVENMLSYLISCRDMGLSLPEPDVWK